MRIIRNRAVVEDTWRPEWRHEGGGERGALPPGDVIVSLARWHEERALLRTRAGRTGVLLEPGDDVDRLAPDLDGLDLVALDFPGFADGRGYSQARLLRERFGFRGEIRATGYLSSDLLPFMERCGIDAFEVPAEMVSAALDAFGELSVHYQPAPGGGGEIAPCLRGMRPLEQPGHAPPLEG